MNKSNLLNDKLASIANEFINSQKKECQGDDIPGQVHEDLQVEVKKLYKEIKNKIDFGSEKSILDSIANLSALNEHTNNTSAVIRMFPKFYRQKSGTSMECTLASSILKLALEEKGHKNVYTVLLKGHQITMKEEDETVVLYDPSTRWTDDESVSHGFILRFNTDEIKKKDNVYDKQGNYRGFKFRIETKEKPPHTGMFEPYDQKKKIYYRDYFASEANTLIELSVVLQNLNDLKDKNSFDSLKSFDADEIIENLEIFSLKSLI